MHSVLLGLIGVPISIIPLLPAPAAASPQSSSIAAFDQARIDATVQRVKSCDLKEVHGSRNDATGGIQIWVDDATVADEQLACTARLKVRKLPYWYKIDFKNFDDPFYALLRQEEDKVYREQASAAGRRVAAACGFKDVRVERYHRDWDSSNGNYYLKVYDDTVTRKQRICPGLEVLNELGSDYEVQYRGSAIRPLKPDGLYHGRLYDEQRREDARDTLSRRGVLSQVPKYRPGRSNALIFARSLERLCGPRAIGAFRRAKKNGDGVTAGHFIWNSHLDRDNDTEECLAATVVVSGLPFDHLYYGD